MLWTKKSVGIILFSDNYKQVLMVQKRVTNAFAEFVRGKYRTRTDADVLFNGMTKQEKLMLLSLKFEYIWYYLYLDFTQNEFYYKCQGKFNDYISDGGKRLKHTIDTTKCALGTSWEPPKGRKNKDESNIECAVRELKEETGISDDLYKFLFHLKNNKYKCSAISHETQYKVVYYTARIFEHKDPRFILSNYTQTSELLDTKWISVKDLISYPMMNELRQYIIALASKIAPQRKNKDYIYI